MTRCVWSDILRAPPRRWIRSTSYEGWRRVGAPSPTRVPAARLTGRAVGTSRSNAVANRAGGFSRSVALAGAHDLPPGWSYVEPPMCVSRARVQCSVGGRGIRGVRSSGHRSRGLVRGGRAGWVPAAVGALPPTWRGLSLVPFAVSAEPPRCGHVAHACDPPPGVRRAVTWRGPLALAGGGRTPEANQIGGTFS